MCGIAGVVCPDRVQPDAENVARMIDSLAHRGPDDRGVHVELQAALGHARLSVIDLAGGHQPMTTDDGSLWITFNGEIFNYIELRRELEAKGHRFRTQTDTEVILHLFRDVGEACVEKMNGQWAFAIWDARARSLFISRDRLGVRPLFYTCRGGQLIFASEIKALFAHPGVPRQLDVQTLDNIFTFWTALPPRTMFAGVSALPPGHSLTWRDGRVTVSQYWHPDYAAMDDPLSAAEAADAVQAALEDATRIRLRSDIPLGAYLSGGLDSSLITALMTKVAGRAPRTFGIAFDDPLFDESTHQRCVATALGTEHHELRCSAADISSAFADVVWHAETPLLRTAPAPMFLLARFAREHGCPVVLTGEGADELFGGYDIFKEAKIRRFWAKNPASRWRASLVKRLYPYLSDLQRQPAESLQAFFRVAPDDLADPCFSHLPRWRVTSRLKLLFSESVQAGLGGYDGRAELGASLPPQHRGWDPFSMSQYLETAHLLPGYLLSSQGDRAAMAHGVEARYPFLDIRVVGLASKLPPSMKMAALNEKVLLKRIAKPMLPPTVWQRKKQPYRAPGARALFAGPARAYVDDLLSPSQLRRDGVFNPDAVARLVKKVESGGMLSQTDDMAAVGVLSTQILIDRFINNFGTHIHGSADRGTASLHRREIPVRG